MPRAVDLRRVAEWTGTTIDEIQALNPELRRWTTPVKYPDYEVKVPVGTADRLATRLASAPASDLGALNWYTVKSGETLTTVARKLRVARVDLAEANNLSVRSRIRPGQDLIIPRAPATLMAAHADRPAPVDRRVARHRRPGNRSHRRPGGGERTGGGEPSSHLSREARRHALLHRAGCSTPPSPSCAASIACAPITLPSATG